MTQKTARISYTRPSITKLERDYVADAIATGWGPKCYDYIVRFEALAAEKLGIKHAIATSSCTGAMHMGCYASGVTEGTEVILADANWIATAAPICHLGARPVFVDVNPETWCIDPEEVRKAITPKTRAIVATHLYGNLCDMNALSEIAEQNKLVLIEDAAEALGGEYCGAKAGTMGSFGVFSFHGTKTITTGEGGLFVTNDSALYEQVLTLSNHGRSRKQTKQFWPDEVGFKFKMSNVQAAIGLAQFERFNELVDRKREILETYRELLSGIEGVKFNPIQRECVSGAWMPTVVFCPSLGITTSLALERFQKEGIDARVFFSPLSGMPMFKNNEWPSRLISNSVSSDIANVAVNLPSYHDMNLGDQVAVSQIIKSLVSQRTVTAT